MNRPAPSPYSDAVMPAKQKPSASMVANVTPPASNKVSAIAKAVPIAVTITGRRPNRSDSMPTGYCTSSPAIIAAETNTATEAAPPAAAPPGSAVA